jgi:hypothetical protein
MAKRNSGWTGLQWCVSVLLRWWTVVMRVSILWEHEHQCVCVVWGTVTIRDARRDIYGLYHRCVRGSLIRCFPAFMLKRGVRCLPPEIAQLKHVN